MAASLLTTYSSGDSGAPAMTGVTGSMATLLNSILVTGYGNKPGQGWTKPLADISAGVGSLASGVVYIECRNNLPLTNMSTYFDHISVI